MQISTFGQNTNTKKIKKLTRNTIILNDIRNRENVINKLYIRRVRELLKEVKTQKPLI